MPDGRPRPLLFLDVDGPLIPIGSPPEPTDEQTGNPRLDPRCMPPALWHLLAANPLLGRLNPQHGQWLAALPCDLVWATTWMTDANEVISPLLGLPDLPVVEWPDTDDEPRSPLRLHWKTRALVAWAGKRPFVWIDDEITDADRRWVEAHHPGPALLHAVDPRCGLTRIDVATIRAWLAMA